MERVPDDSYEAYLNSLYDDAEDDYDPEDDADSEVGNRCIYCRELAEDCVCPRGADLPEE